MLAIWCALGMMPNKVAFGLGLNAHNALVVLPHLKPLSNVLTEAWEDILAFAYRTTTDHADGNVSSSSILYWRFHISSRGCILTIILDRACPQSGQTSTVQVNVQFLPQPGQTNITDDMNNIKQQIANALSIPASSVAMDVQDNNGTVRHLTHDLSNFSIVQRYSDCKRERPSQR
jgi:hypothetical protein